MDRNLKPLVSIIVPIYNAEKYIDKCLESICSQSYTNIEILLMLGICTDQSLRNCARWQKKDKRIIIVSRKDHSLGDARNFAFDISKGKYIAYVDIDDCIEQDYIDRLVQPLEADEEITISCCGFDVYGDSERIKGWIPSEKGLLISSLDTYLDRIPFGMVWLKMYRRSWFLEKNISMYDGCHEDDALHICLAANVKSIYFVPQALYHYNIGNEKSLMNGARQKKELISALRYAFQYLKSQDLYFNNVSKLCKFTTNILIRFLRDMNYENELFNEILEFWKEFFPELALEMQFYKENEKKMEQNIVIFGAGDDGKEAVKKIGPDRIAYIVDNDEGKVGKKINGIRIVPFRTLLREKRPTIVLISSSMYFFEIAKQLRMNGITNYMDFVEYIALGSICEGENQRNI